MIGIHLGAAFLGGVCWGAGILLPLAALVVLALIFSRQTALVITSFAIVLAALLGVWRREPAPAVPIPVWADQAVAVSGRIVSVPAATIKRRRFLLEVNAVEHERAWRTAGGRLLAWVPLIPAVRLGDEGVLT